MPYRKVEFRTGEYYHLYNRGNNREAIFLERRNYSHFLRLCHRYLAETSLDLVAYCLMPNHYHFLVCLRTDNLSQRMQPFALAYTNAINKEYGRVGSLFQGRFQAVHVDRDEYLVHLSRYIHRNPVKARLAPCSEDWEFSSYREYLGLRNDPMIKPDAVLSQFDSREAYRAFVEAYTESDLKSIEHLMLD